MNYLHPSFKRNSSHSATNNHTREYDFAPIDLHEYALIQGFSTVSSVGTLKSVGVRCQMGMITRGGTRGWQGGRAGQNRFPERSDVVSIRGMCWLGVLLRLTPKPSVRFTACVPCLIGKHTRLPRGRTEKPK